MKEKKKHKDGVGRRRPLRKRAEETLRSRSSHRNTAKDVDLRRLVHELEIHQIELKLQNEELRNAQVELAASRDRYTDLYEFAPLAYLTMDKEGKILEGNLMAAEMFGVQLPDLLHSTLTKFITSESQDSWYLHRQAALSNDTKQMCELEIRRADGT